LTADKGKKRLYLPPAGHLQYAEGVSVAAKVLRAAYGLRYHYLGGWSLERWLVFLCGVAAVMLLVRGQFLLTTAYSLAAVVFVVAIIVIVRLQRWAACRLYLSFVPEDVTAPDGQALDPVDKILLRVTGQFEVEGKSHFFADTPAYWRTFATREHAVMAMVHPSRFLQLGHMPAQDIGMWYIFFRPEMMRGVVSGKLMFGTSERSALHVCYEAVLAPTTARHGLRLWPGRQKPAKREELYLVFEDQATCHRVWADLVADGR
jgi:hypothetical protein